MKFLVLCVILAVVCAVSAAPAKNACAKSCPFDYTPVCGGPESGSDKPITFGNACVLSNYNCENDKHFVLKSQGECPNSKAVRLS